jgi:cell division protein FtsB
LRRWGAIALLVLLAVALQAKLWWGDGGLGEARELERRVAEQRQENARLQQRNDALEAEVEDLKSGEAAIEDRARSELGMVKPGEVFYRVVDPAANDAAGASGEAGADNDGTDDVDEVDDERDDTEATP